MITSGAFLLIVLYILHAACRPHLPIFARALILVSTGGVVFWWFMSRPDEQQESIRQWVPVHLIYVIVGVIAVAALMVAWAIHLSRREDRRDATAAERQRTPVFHPQTS